MRYYCYVDGSMDFPPGVEVCWSSPLDKLLDLDACVVMVDLLF